MRKALILLALLPLPSFATEQMARFTERCWVMSRPTTCVVMDTRTHDGFLDTRAIHSSQYGYTMTQYWQEGKGFVTWDSVTKRKYKYPYKAVGHLRSQVTPHLVITNVSWD